MARPPGPASGEKTVLADARSPCPPPGSADPALRRLTQCKHSAPAASPLGGRSASTNPHFCAFCHAQEERRGRRRGGRRGSDSPRGQAACARLRGGEGSLGVPPAPARAPRPLTCRCRSEDSHHRHLLDRGLGEGGLADIQPLQRAGHVVVGSHYPH